jgi:Na+/H+ antiporter NhaD/arsenite permease-like protein
VIFLGSLYVVSGGILISVGRKATPLTNCILLLFGAIISNVFGTTGASMLLIRPFLRMNQARLRPYHVVFFIFIVSNAGGMLTPIGDPPLFLGFLRGVPFWWNLQQSRWVWVFVIGVLLAVFFVFDARNRARDEPRQPEDAGPPVGIGGIHNLLFIAVIVAAVFRIGVGDAISRLDREGFSTGGFIRLVFCREMLMLLAIGGSRLLTAKSLYLRNAFSYEPIKEVAILFFGLFSTMVPALQWLDEHAQHIAPRTPGQYYFTTGSLSAVLDNAPTYLAFFELELAEAPREHLSHVLADPLANRKLLAIALGAVLFGAMTYVGNGPNFMVKSLADSTGAPTPHFVQYILVYSLPILLPLYVLVWWIFLR